MHSRHSYRGVHTMCARAYNAAVTLCHVASIIGFPAGERPWSVSSTRKRTPLLSPSYPSPPPLSVSLITSVSISRSLFFQFARTFSFKFDSLRTWKWRTTSIVKRTKKSGIGSDFYSNTYILYRENVKFSRMRKCFHIMSP